jgi:hypothetical protein
MSGQQAGADKSTHKDTKTSASGAQISNHEKWELSQSYLHKLKVKKAFRLPLPINSIEAPSNARESDYKQQKRHLTSFFARVDELSST